MNSNEVIKVDNVGYDKMYFGSKNKIHGDIKLKNNELLFVTPFIALASIFAARPHGDFKIPMGSYNIGYDEWSMSLAALEQKQEPLKEVHISIQGKGYDAIHPYTMESDGYIYEIDISDLKDHIYQHPWMNKEREFLIRDVPSVKVAKCHEISVTCHIYGSKSKNPSYGISNRVPVGFIAQNKFLTRDSECVTEKTVNKYIDKCKYLKRGLSGVRPNENTRGQIWVENGKVVALIVCTKSPLTPPKLVNLEVSPKYKNDLNDLLDYARYVYGVKDLQINESADISVEYTLRPATESDSDNMYEWEMDSIDKSLKDNEKIQQLIRDDVKESIKDTKMIMKDGETIGMFTSCMIDNGEVRYIGEIFIVPGYRNLGIGSSILKSEIDKYDRTQLQVAYDNKHAIELYKSLGFKIIKSDDTSKMHLMELRKEPMNESYIIESTLNTVDTESRCKHMVQQLNGFKYGAVIDGEFKENFNPEELSKQYALMTPEEFELNKGGICWDYTEWEYYHLKKNGLSPEKYFLLMDTPPTYDTHTFVVCKTKEGKYVYPEKSFKEINEKINGCKTFDTIEEIFRLIAYTIMKGKGVKSSTLFNVFKYKNPPKKATIHEFFRYCTKQKLIYSGKTVPKLNNSVHDEKIYPLFVILSEGNTPIISNEIKKKTKSPISHALVSDDPELKTMYTFGEDDSGSLGFSHESFSRYTDRIIHVYTLFLTKEQKDQYDKSIEDFKKHMKASTFDTSVFLYGYFNKTKNKPNKNKYKQVCSTFVNLILKELGVKMTSSSNYMVTPKDLSDGFNIAKDFNKVYLVYEGKGYKYNPNQTKQQLLNLVKSGYNLIEEGIPEQYEREKIDI